ncbi:hypothetical protein DPMN_029507 [Dreissena polymorpha]|uniref:Uncharacterized protein n=1 Tax=Dreissena polymorpha TaxID=45954 RepID=A0A9D4RGB1_DREPO|nr:hypothetical protein DPMN_029507 [Dreissena polymorpha]
MFKVCSKPTPRYIRNDDQSDQQRNVSPNSQSRNDDQSDQQRNVSPNSQIRNDDQKQLQRDDDGSNTNKINNNDQASLGMRLSRNDDQSDQQRNVSPNSQIRNDDQVRINLDKNNQLHFLTITIATHST